jgi:hypothetical protein
MNEKVLFGPKFGTLINRKGLQFSELLQLGPYIVTEVIPGGAYRLQDKKTGKDESNPWNAEQLRRFYV